MEQLSHEIQLFIAFLGILLLAAIVLDICKRTKIPYTVALVPLGIAINVAMSTYYPAEEYPLTWQLTDQIKADVIIFICLPTLIYELAFGLDTNLLLKQIVPIHVLAIPGLALSTAVIGIIFSTFTGTPLLASLLLGVILSATDPVAVIAMFRQFGAPKRLETLVEGESLFNDATTMVGAKTLLVIMAAGVVTSSDVFIGATHFFEEFFGGIAIGAIVALAFGYILGKIENEADVELTLVTMIAYASFIIAQVVFEVSGVMSTATAGLVMSGWGRTKITPSVAEYIDDIWKFLGHVANTLVFILIGLSIHLGDIEEAMIPLGILIIAMLVSRFLVIFGLLPLTPTLKAMGGVSWKYRTIMFWGGLRGGIALAIVLGLEPFPYKDLFIVLVTGAVLFTLLVQGLTLESLIHYLGLDETSINDKIAVEKLTLSGMRRALKKLPELKKGGLFSHRITTQFEEDINKKLSKTTSEINELERQMSWAEKKQQIMLQCLGIEKKCYEDMFINTFLTEGNYRHLHNIINFEIDNIRFGRQEDFEHKELRDREKGFFTMIKNFRNTFPVNVFFHFMQNKVIPSNYERNWAQYLAAITVLNHLEESISERLEDEQLANEIISHYLKLKGQTQSNLDAIAEHFPSFAQGVQKQMIDKLIVQSEKNTLEDEYHLGSIPNEVVIHMRKMLEEETINLKRKTIKSLTISTKEQLERVPLFKQIPKDGMDELMGMLEVRIIEQGDEIVKQGTQGNSMFLITQGVVRIIYEDEDKKLEIATLYAGDFFGEMALIHQEPRTATALAKTPCILFELHFQDFNRLCSRYPEIMETIEIEDSKRRKRLLLNSPLFQRSTETEFDELASTLKVRLSDKGETIVKQGEEGLSMFFIDRGYVNVIIEAKGREQVVAKLGPGDFFGEIALLEKLPRTATVRAATHCALYEMSKKDFDDIINNYPHLKQYISQVARERIESAQHS